MFIFLRRILMYIIKYMTILYHIRLSITNGILLLFSGYVIASSTQETMLMYGKEASNRKQEIDRQHYTIPNQRPKDKHCGKI